jgi:hypothetical protein
LRAARRAEQGELLLRIPGDDGRSAEAEELDRFGVFE